jgi:hypothetical protein
MIPGFASEHASPNYLCAAFYSSGFPSLPARVFGAAPLFSPQSVYLSCFDR